MNEVGTFRITVGLTVRNDIFRFHLTLEVLICRNILIAINQISEHSERNVPTFTEHAHSKPQWARKLRKVQAKKPREIK